MRPEKELLIAELKKQIESSPFVVLTDYKGVNVTQFAELRKRLRAVKAECHVVKNSMLQRAAKASGLPDFNGSLTGQTAIVVGGDDADLSAAARVVKEFSREFEKLKFKLGVLGKQILKAEEVSAVADLPSREVLRAQLLGLLQAPATRLTRVLSAKPSELLSVLKQFEQKQAEQKS
jgi:large subunit ribosomal protein L10